MIEKRESEVPSLTPVDRAVLDAVDRAEGMCMNEVTRHAQFKSVFFQDFSQANPQFSPDIYNFHFRATVPSPIGPTSGPYRTYDDAANALMASFLCISSVRNDLFAAVKKNKKYVNIKVVSDQSELNKLAYSYDGDGECVQNGIALARAHLFSAFLHCDNSISKRSVLQRDDGAEVLLQTYPSAIYGVWWRVYTEGDKMDEVIRIDRKST